MRQRQESRSTNAAPNHNGLVTVIVTCSAYKHPVRVRTHWREENNSMARAAANAVAKRNKWPGPFPSPTDYKSFTLRRL